MKFKYVVLFMVFFVSYGVKAQKESSSGRNFEKGKFFIGLNGIGSYLSSGHSFSVSPWAGYFVSKNLTTGIRIAYGKDILNVKHGTPLVSDYKLKSLAPEVFLRYYTPKIKVKPFVQVAVGYNFQWGTVQTEKVKDSNVIGSAEGGILFPVGRRLSIDASYNWRAFSTSKLIDANEKGNIRLGLSYKF